MMRPTFVFKLAIGLPVIACWGEPDLAVNPGTASGISVPLRPRLARLAENLNALVDTEDLLDTLHFGWFDRPYARATLAVTVKTMAAIERESALRARGRGAIADGDLAAMMGWCERALERAASSPPRSGFRPSRVCVTVDQIRTLAASAPMVVFVDEASSTRHSESYGDLDLLAALGQRVYARRGAYAGSAFDAICLGRVDYLGMAALRVGAVSAGGVHESNAAAGDSDTVRGYTLAELLQAGSLRRQNHTELAVVADPVRGETWEESLARRALARGALGNNVYAVADWQLPSGSNQRDGKSDVIVAALWMDALDGQQLTLMSGWRDLRDGSASPYASVVQQPDFVEAVAHTALDFVRLADQIATYRSVPAVAVAIGPDAIHGQDSNRWALWTLPIWSSLARHQIAFDVVDSRMAAMEPSSRYRKIIRISQGSADDAMALARQLEAALESASDAAVRVAVREMDGSLARDVYLRQAKLASGGMCIAVINLSPDKRRLNLSGTYSQARFHDLLDPGRAVNGLDTLVMGPWRVRLLWPAGD